MRPGLRLRLLNNVPPSNHMTREGSKSSSSLLRDEWNRKRANKGALLTFTALTLLTVGVIMNWIASDMKLVTTNVQSLVSKETEAETIGGKATESAIAISDNQHVTTDDINKQTHNTLKFHKFTLKTKEMFMWKGRQRKLCKHMQTVVKNNEQQQQQQQPLVAYAKVSCQQLHVQKRHGNLIYGLYAMHLAAMANGIDLVFECKETKKESNNNVFWWLQSRPDDIMETRALLRQSTTELYDEETLSSKDACRGMGKITFGYAYNLARAQLRNMAIGTFGARQFGESKNTVNTTTTMSSLSSSLQTTPLYPDEELDQVAIHFRCGDVLDGFPTTNYGMVPFDVYRSALLASNTTYSSIGIVTQPFKQGKNLRSLDAKHSKGCEQIVTSLQNYLSHHFSHAKVTIRNSQSDTIPMVMSRLVLAEHTICIRSTFCVFPALATFGEATFLPEGVAYFVDPIARSHPNIHLLDSNNVPFLFSKQIKKLGLNKTIFWLEHKVMT